MECAVATPVNPVPSWRDEAWSHVKRLLNLNQYKAPERQLSTKEMAMNDPRPITFVRQWKKDGSSRMPYWIYTDPEVYRREQERLFNGPHWNYVALEAEIPNPGDFKRSYVGERSVIVVRDEDGSVSVVENRCAHRGAQFCQEHKGNKKEFVCPYHQWNYDLKGNLLGVPFLRGIKGKGGMPKDFKRENHSLTQLKVHVHNGVVFASFHPDVPDFETFLGPTMLKYFERVFDGRKLKVLGYNRQRVRGNWKLIHENLKDCYHPGLLHTWFVNFGLWRADNDSLNLMDDSHAHSAMVTVRNEGGKGEATAGISSFREHMELNDPRFLDVETEPWWDGPTAVIQSIFPSVIMQQQVNSLAVRHLVPRGPGAFDYIWTQFGFEDDSPELTQRRLRQGNLFGHAGFVSADDAEITDLLEAGAMQATENDETLCELGGHEIADTDTHVSETLIRGMYQYYRKIMEI